MRISDRMNKLRDRKGGDSVFDHMRRQCRSLRTQRDSVAASEDKITEYQSRRDSCEREFIEFSQLTASMRDYASLSCWQECLHLENEFLSGKVSAVRAFLETLAVNEGISQSSSLPESDSLPRTATDSIENAEKEVFQLKESLGRASAVQMNGGEALLLFRRQAALTQKRCDGLKVSLRLEESCISDLLKTSKNRDDLFLNIRVSSCLMVSHLRAGDSFQNRIWMNISIR